MPEKMSTNPRVLVGFLEVAGYFANLFEGLTSHGIKAGYINNGNFDFHYYYNNKNNDDYLNKYIRFSAKIRKRNTLINKLLHALYSLYILVRICRDYDVFVVSCSGSLFWLWEYRLFKALGKKVICVSLGSSTRPPYLNGRFKDDLKDGLFDIEMMISSARDVNNRVKFFEKYCTYFLNYPQHSQFNINPFVNGMFIGFPTKLPKFETTTSGSSTIKIVHAPSRPKAKGSDVFRKVIAELRAEGIQIDLIELVNTPNPEVLAAIQGCDIVLDELYSDMPLGGLGTEAAMFAKPVVVGGYYAEAITNEVDPELIPPSKYVMPTDIKEALRELCLDEALRIEIGNKLRAFIEKQWSLEKVASRYLNLIQGEIDPRWMANPEYLSYLEGWGLSRKEVAENVAKLINYPGGVKNLQLSNPAILKKYMNLVEHAS